MKKVIDREKVLELIKKGLSDEEIARLLKCSYIRIYQIRTKELGIYKRKEGLKKDRILTLLDNGFSKEEIAKMLNTTIQYVYYVGRSCGKIKKKRLNVEIGASIRMLAEVLKGPKTERQLKEMGLKNPSIFYRILRSKGIKIRKYYLLTFSRNRKAKPKCRRGDKIIYYMPEHKLEAYKMIKKIVGKNVLSRHKRCILKALGIEYVCKRGTYYLPNGQKL